MIVIFFVTILFSFLLVGALAFVCCVLVPHIRSHALSVAMWFAMCGPCILGVLLVAGLGLVGAAVVSEHSTRVSPQRVLSALGPFYFGFGLLGTVLISSGAAWLHQVLIERMTFALFRLYACAVTVGIGSVFGWSLGFWMQANNRVAGYVPIWLTIMLMICSGFGYAGYRWAKLLRGEAPSEFTWITPQEYESTG